MKQLVKRWLALGMSFAMAFTMIPAGSGDVVKAEEKDEQISSARNIPDSLSDYLLAEYDFADYKETGNSTLVSGEDDDAIELTLEAVGSGIKPKLVEDDDRGQVLSLTQQDYANRAFALLPSNPFAGQSVDNGLTLNFWTNTTGDGGGARCLLDFEVAPATSGRAGTLAINQQMVYWNTTDQGGTSRFTDFATGNLELTKDNGWTMVTVAFTTNGISFYRNGVKIAHTISSGTADYNNMIKDLTGNSTICSDSSLTNVRLGASLATYWTCAGALMDDVSFYSKELDADEITALYKATGPAVKSVTINSAEKIVGVGKTLPLSISVLPETITMDKTPTWKSNDTSILTVSENGIVTGVAEGTTSVVATLGGVASAEFEIEVVSTIQGQLIELLNGYSLEQTNVTKDFTLPNAMTLPEDGGPANVSWISKDESLIKIETDSETGTITARVTVPNEAKKVVLTATATLSDKTASKDYEVIVRPEAVIGKSAIATYDFADYQLSGTTLVRNDNNKTIQLESAGSGTKPTLTDDDKRGQVLSLTRQSYANRAYALLPENPFAGKSTEEGLTLNFWAKITGSREAANDERQRALIDFEVAPATTKRAGTLAVTQTKIYWNTTDQNEKYTDFAMGDMLLAGSGWTMVTVAFTETGITFYKNGLKISHSIDAGTEDYGQMINDLVGGLSTPAETKVRLGASLATYWTCVGALMDDVSFYEKALSADEVAALYQETMVPIELETVTISGKNSVDEDESISLTAAAVPVDATVDKTVTWESSDESILTVNQNGRVRGVQAGTATVKATIAGVDSEPFSITVNPVETGFQAPLEKGYYITVYSTEQSFYSSGNRREQEARSVYMAVSKDGVNFDVLNNGGAVIYSKNGQGSSQVTKPRIFKDGNKYIVEAPDVTASNGIHVYTSADGVNYYQEELLTSTGRTTPNQLRKSSIHLLLHGEDILDTDDTITLGNAISLSEEEYNSIYNKLGTVVNNGLESLATLEITSEETEALSDTLLHEIYPSINATYTDGSVQNFKIDWTDALENIEWTEGENTIIGKVVQPKYLNNLKALNDSQLKDDDPENVNPDYPDNVNPETGEVYYDATKFIEGMADPYIYWDETNSYYYMTSSYFPEDGDAMEGETPDQYDRVVLRRGKTLEELQTRANQVTIWKVGNQKFTDKDGSQKDGYRYIWAPEIHRVGDYWVVYFTESHSGNNAFNIYCHALVLPGDKDPYETALTTSNEVSQWTDYRMCSTQSTDPFDTSFCLDMTYFKNEEDGESYVIWAGKPSDGNTDLYIAKVDENNPWKITTAATKLTKAEYGWERIEELVNEGPTILQHDGKIFLCYSGAGTGSEYAIGMLSVDADADLLNASSWTKSPYPLLSSRDVNGEEGPGHNSFTVDKDGNVIFVYHARPTSHNYRKCGNYSSSPLNDPCRHARLKRVHWAADGTPILKMTYEDELIDDYKTVTLTINVGEGGSTLPVPVSSVRLSEDELSLEVGNTSTLEATVLPENATHKTLSWDSSDPSVATVADGKVTAKAEGITIITATAVSGVSASCEVTVTAKANAPTGLTLNKTELSLNINGTEKLIATVVPAGASYEGIEWSSSDAETVYVAATGEVTAKKAGTATITASIKGTDPVIKAECEVTVSSTVETNITGIELSKNAISLAKGSDEKLTFTVKPEGIDYDEANITWASDNEETATVDAGTVTAVEEGTANITVTLKDTKNDKEFSDTCVVTVTKTSSSTEVPVTEVNLNKTTLALKVGAEETLTATIAPSNATIKTVTWTSSDPTVASVDAGKVKALKAGSAVITAEAGAVKATCTVTVTTDSTGGTGGSSEVALTGITLSKKTLKLGVKETFTLKAALKPANTTVKTAVSWKSSNTKVATVNKNGKITSKKKGTATITASIGNIKATCKVTVCAAPTKITLKKTKVSLKKGKTAQISVKAFKPKKAYCSIFTYSSKNKKIATVSATGKITAKKKGTATITVTCKNNKKAKATVKVTVK